MKQGTITQIMDGFMSLVWRISLSKVLRNTILSVESAASKVQPIASTWKSDPGLFLLEDFYLSLNLRIDNSLAK
jgi:hypothetical protein